MADTSEARDRIHTRVVLTTFDEIGRDLTDEEYKSQLRTRLRQCFDANIEEIEVVERERL